MKIHRARHPRVECLEARALLNGAPAPTQPAAEIATQLAQLRVALTGSLQGTLTRHTGIPDVGTTYTMVVSGRVGPLGNVQAAGSFHTPGFIRQGRAEGTMTLAGRWGSVTLKLVGPTVPGFSGPPSSFTYTIVKGTGRFLHAQGSGTVALHLNHPANPAARATLTFHAATP